MSAALSFGEREAEAVGGLAGSAEDAFIFFLEARVAFARPRLHAAPVEHRHLAAAVRDHLFFLQALAALVTTARVTPASSP